MRRGFLIALEGIDQSGKKTQAQLLVQELHRRGLRVRSISFPDYSTPVGAEIRAFLDGLRAFSAQVRQLLYAANRWERKEAIEGWLEGGEVVVADRYIPSGLAYGLANGLELDWMLALERGLPEPDLVIVFDISPETAFKRGKRRDAYERDLEFLKRVRTAYLELARRLGWIVVDGERSVEEVHREVWEVVSSRLMLSRE